jgi:hypothetical protein
MAAPNTPPTPMQPPSGPGAFSNRADRNPGQPIRVPNDTQYGMRKRLEGAQAAVPLPNLDAGPVGRPPGPGGPGAAPGALQPGPPQPTPNDLLSTLSHPTQRPNEPLTTPSGLGVGTPDESIADMLNRSAQQNPGNSAVAFLRDYVNSGRR